MNENEWLEVVRGIAKMYRWQTYHTHRSDRSEAGWPDLVIIKPPRMLVVELKSEKGKLTRAQRQWLGDLAACGVEVAVWRPADQMEVIRILGPTGERAALRLPAA